MPLLAVRAADTSSNTAGARLLIAGSRFEAWLVSAHKAFNTDHLLFTHVCGYTLHIEEMSKVHDLEFLQGLFKVVARMKQLQLTTEEECILKGMSILSGG